jgi:hypothetical protein
LHIYHFAPYEPAALKRLMGRYATREDELDQLLRGNRFVDLFAVVRQGLRASVESYSIKRLEPLYGYLRAISLPDANQALAKVQAFLELGDSSGIGNDERQVVEGYNRDDCQSTWRLRDWLETLRTSAIAGGDIIDRPTPPEAKPGEALTERQLKIAALVDRLISEVPDDPSERTGEQHGRWILGHILGERRRRRCTGIVSRRKRRSFAAVKRFTLEGCINFTTKRFAHRPQGCGGTTSESGCCEVLGGH